MEKKYEDIFHLKNKLWELRHLECLNLKTPSWSENEVMIVLKRLKTNKTRDPLGMINELFKPGVVGKDLVYALTALLNEVKFLNFVPQFMRLANITSIWKKKASKSLLQNDRGIFVLTIVRMIMDRLLYNDFYSEKNLTLNE